MVGGVTHSSGNFGPNWPCWGENADIQLIFARSASAVTPSEKSSININRKSTTRFPMSLRWTSYVVPKPPKGARKRKTAVFRVELHFAWRKSGTKFFCMNTVSDKVVRHSIHWPIYTCKNDSRGHLLLPENLAETNPLSKTPISNQFARSASGVRNSTTGFPMSLRWTVHVASPQRGLQNIGWPFFSIIWTIP